jgi:hypothetical protein
LTIDFDAEKGKALFYSKIAVIGPKIKYGAGFDGKIRTDPKGRGG